MTLPEKTNPAMTDDKNSPTSDDLLSQIEAMKTLMARRFDELSMEINATSQQIDMNEDGMGKRFSEVLETLGAINYLGHGDSAANTGVELESVIHDTEDAANTILDSADRISSYLNEDVDWSDKEVRGEVRKKMRDDIQDILMACTFQDLTGQRIRNTLNSLHDIETRLSTTFERLGIAVEPDQKEIEKKIVKASSQSEIDALLKGYNAAEDAAGSKDEESEEDGDSSQGDIDSMFE